MAWAPKPEKSGRKMPPILMIASIAMTHSGVSGMNTAIASPFPSPSDTRAPASRFTLGAQLRVGERPHRALLALPTQRDARIHGSAGVFIEAVVNDVHAPADAPLRPLRPAREVHDFFVTLVEPDIEAAKHRIPEPRDVRRGALLELVERTDAVLIDEVPEIASLYDFGSRPPDDGTLPANWRLNAHGGSGT